jgi:hypothetical protein
MISCGWIISYSCSWITVYVLCCNAQMNLIVIFMTCTCIVMHSLFCQLPNCNLFIQHYFTSPQTNISFHTVRLIICFQQTSEIDNLTVSWGIVVWLCCVQVPRCCWRRGSLVDHAPDCFLAPCQSQLAITFRSDFFLLLVN